MGNKLLDEESRKVAKSNLKSELEDAIGNAPTGLKEDDLDDCWKLAKEYWNITKIVKPIH